MKFKLYLLLLSLISIVSILELLHTGLPITHDGIDHLARIANFYQNLQQGNIIPRWAGNLNWGYGHPILEFLYPLPSYLVSFFHALNFSFIDATKIVFAIGMLFGGICMYFWLAEFLDIPAAFIGGMLYTFTPYRFVETYVRGDIGENLAFMFMPLVLYCIYKLYKTKNHRYVIIGAIALALLILAHNAISLMYLPFIIFYCIYLAYISKNKKYFIFNSLMLILLGFCLSAFFWLPGLLEGKFTLRNIVTAGEYRSRFVTLQSLFYGPWSYGGTGFFTTQLGVVNWITLFFSIPISFLLWKRKDKSYTLTVGLLIYSIGAIFLMLPIANFIWVKVLLLQNFQFPWRFLAVTVFSTSVLGAIVTSILLRRESIRKLIRKDVLIVCVLTLVILFFNKDYWHAQNYLYKPDRYFTGIYDGTTDTGESAPVWSIRFMEKRPKAPMEIISGSATIHQGERKITRHDYIVIATTKTRLRENTLFFPGWRVLVDSKCIPIQFQDGHNRGLMTFYVEKGKHTVSVVYRETKLRKLADIISLVSLGIVVVIFILRQLFRKK